MRRVASRGAGREWERRAVSTAFDGCRSIEDDVIALYLEVVVSRSARIGWAYGNSMGSKVTVSLQSFGWRKWTCLNWIMCVVYGKSAFMAARVSQSATWLALSTGYVWVVINHPCRGCAGSLCWSRHCQRFRAQLIRVGSVSVCDFWMSLFQFGCRRKPFCVSVNACFMFLWVSSKTVR